ncbi:MAG: hypothetical protein A2925_04480 [Candidatus Yanofskybacteria bacterium RIFCSPLOWO2_01_FULL_44_22]|uniref:Peptidase M48 domain-containing protein n=2 Tax=Candidatus Yanofskyibacteriota TaxID=1752733 RepID=A0A1F8GNE9_9BACT|nr:MAG: hypothetical protein A2659_00100 [Candidatus Yanofskybacteria bacterium RIFCSPHIGHO2_01_FULL_44_24]OGN25959.1 MAG: hypothetical protein A2925_04480 [Candidatus Yanofskybacteria bacterium RIFCSPLOWO2_01_FULL_44_22]
MFFDKNWLGRMIFRFFAGLLGCFLLINIYALGFLETEEHKTDFPAASLYNDQVVRYYEQINEARKRFKVSLSIHDPCYVIVFKADYLNAYYFWVYKCIYITEKALIEFTPDELAGLLAHEFAHAEEAERFGDDFRPHWMVDVRAAEIAGKSGILSVVKKLKKESDRKTNFLRKHPYLFFLAIRLVNHNAEYDDRIAHINAVPD